MKQYAKYEGIKICRHTERFRRQERLGRLLAQGRTGQSPDPIQGLKIRGNITTVSSYKGELVNINLADVGIDVDEEDDDWSVQVS